MKPTLCRSCQSELKDTFIDLGDMPLSNAFRRAEALDQVEPVFPLHARVCGRCFLVQVETFQTPEELFRDYPYFSSCSDSWVDHAREYAEKIVAKLRLKPGDRVAEIACNDGYLLKNLLGSGLELLGIEPARNVAQSAIGLGIPVVEDFFSSALARQLAAERGQMDLLIANNVLAHVPDLNDFVAGIRILLKPQGIATLEFPHLLRLMEGRQFDTIYHEHFSYFSLVSVEWALGNQGLKVVDVEELPTHGGSLRVYAMHREAMVPPSAELDRVRFMEKKFGMDKLETYTGFGPRVEALKRNLLSLLIRLKKEGARIAGYGAPAKGSILLNFCGIREDFLDFTVDRNLLKQGRYMPGTRILISPPEKIFAFKPDFLLLLPWNLREEILEQMKGIRDWGGKFVLPLPEPRIL